ncbi:MAG TPA: MmgE/PrpD family protein, partial [Bacilli bacterium]|nr:MmgE/PrpD family protein [Bacilli bacterium]
VLSEQIRFDSLVENLGETYYLLKSYFKFYSYCRFCHSPVDAVIDLIQDVQIEDIKEIRVYTYSSAARLHERKVNNEFAGKFSIPYAVASEICKHQYPLLDSSLLENKICKLIEKVFVEEEKSYTDMLPGKRVTTVELELLNGNIKGKTVQRAMGDADEENLFEKVISKNREFLNPIIGEDRANTLIKKILSIEEQNDLSFLAQLRR